MLRLTIDRIGDLARPDEIFVYHRPRAARRRARRGARASAGSQRDRRARGIATRRRASVSPPWWPSACTAARPCWCCPPTTWSSRWIAFPRTGAGRLAVRGVRGRTHDALLTFGIVPTRPETGYGYVRPGAELWHEGGTRRVRGGGVSREADGRSGARAGRGRLPVEQRHVRVATDTPPRRDSAAPARRRQAVLARIAAALGTRPTRRGVEWEYRGAPSVSIDYGLMEKARQRGGDARRFHVERCGQLGIRSRREAADTDGNVRSASTS